MVMIRILGHTHTQRLLSAELLWSEGCDECKSDYRMEENICVGEWACECVGVCLFDIVSLIERYQLIGWY